MSSITRRTFLASSAALPHAMQALAATKSSEQTVYLGGKTGPGTGKGIYRAAFNPATGALEVKDVAVETGSPTFLAAHGRLIFAVNEKGQKTDTVSSFLRQPDGSLKELSQVPALGASPCYISIHPSGRAAYVANYASGSISTYTVQKDGTLSQAIVHLEYKGHGPHPRQDGAHAHSTTLSPDGRFLYVNDLGQDQIHIYRIDHSNPAQLTPADPPVWQGNPGTGPRHLALPPKGNRYAYSLNEIANTIDILDWNSQTGTLKTVGSPVPTLAEGFSTPSTSAEIAISSDGRFLYTSNRGEDTITVFSIATGIPGLTLIQRESTRGRVPRHFTLCPDGRFLLAANQDTNNVAVFKRDVATGRIDPTVHVVDVPSPMYILFV